MTSLKFKKFSLEAYKPGKSNIKKKDNIIKLSANESALGISPKAKKVLLNKNLFFNMYLLYNKSWKIKKLFGLQELVVESVRR